MGVLDGPFRPFFLLSSFVAIAVPTVWVLSFAGLFEMENSFSSLMAWHAHEMIFGMGGALIAGFLLTASAHWSNKEAFTGSNLLILSVLWMQERAIFFFGESGFLILISSISFTLIFLIYLYIMLKDNKKNLLIIFSIMLLFALFKFLFLYGDMAQVEWARTYGVHGGIYTIIMLISIITARVIPFFTEKRIGESWRPRKEIQFSSFAGHFLLIILPPDLYDTQYLYLLYTFVFLADLAVFISWRPWKSIRVPMLSILHVGYLWILVGLFLSAFGLYTEDVMTQQLSVHALMAGGFTTIAIGIMVRVTKGHTGAKVKAHKLDLFIFMLVITGALLRVLVPLVDYEAFLNNVLIINIVWISPFFLYILVYGKRLCMKRVQK
jgi:uncharacterized protein involved in response to NO